MKLLLFPSPLWVGVGVERRRESEDEFCAYVDGTDFPSLPPPRPSTLESDVSDLDVAQPRNTGVRREKRDQPHGLIFQTAKPASQSARPASAPMSARPTDDGAATR